MTESRFDPEEEAFNEIERQARQRKEAVAAQMKPKTPEEFYAELRNNVIEEVARDIEQMTGFGQDTIDSFAIYIRGMKK